MLKLVWVALMGMDVREDLACSPELQSIKTGSTVWPLEHRTVIVDHYSCDIKQTLFILSLYFDFDNPVYQ